MNRIHEPSELDRRLTDGTLYGRGGTMYTPPGRKSGRNFQTGRPTRKDEDMALAIVVTLEKALPDAAAAYAKAGNGKALARETDRLDTAARARKVTPMTSLLS